MTVRQDGYSRSPGMMNTVPAKKITIASPSTRPSLADAYLSSLSQINSNIYLSGVTPLSLDPDIINRAGIKFILCCVSKKYTQDYHIPIILKDPKVVVVYLPYNDDLKQNLWSTDPVEIYSSNPDVVSQLKKLYANKPLIDVANHFLKLAIKKKARILVHCMAGISRSVSMICYYLIRNYKMKFSDAVGIIQSKRPIANPNGYFRQQLQAYSDKMNK